jgi:hypothetical protein
MTLLNSRMVGPSKSIAKGSENTTSETDLMLSLKFPTTATAAWKAGREFRPIEQRSRVTPRWLGSDLKISEKIL